jgi:hypothetical protein
VRSRCYTTATSRDRSDHSNDLAKEYYARSELAEAEGFEPPDPLGSLAFKVVDPAISSDHHSTMGRSSTMHGHPWVLPIAGECNHKCNHCGTPLGRPSPAGMLTDEGL